MLVTLFGTATSLGIGALQIRTGVSIITGKELGNGFVVVAISILTVVFTISAVAGIKKGIRLLSNLNMTLVILLALFALLVGPTFFLLDLLPVSLIAFAGNLPDMLTVFAGQGAEQEGYLTAWTTLYWAWWISWSPLVGMFIAKISKGRRTLRQFVTVVAPGCSEPSFLPSLVRGPGVRVCSSQKEWQRTDRRLQRRRKSPEVE